MHPRVRVPQMAFSVLTVSCWVYKTYLPLLDPRDEALPAGSRYPSLHHGPSCSLFMCLSLALSGVDADMTPAVSSRLRMFITGGQDCTLSSLCRVPSLP